MTERLPSSLDGVLRNLQSVKDALVREGIVEAAHYVNEATANVRTEMDWTLDTNPDLPFILDFLQTLLQGFNRALVADPSCRTALITTIIEEIDTVTTKVTRITKGMQAHSAPESLDYLERQRLARKHT